MSIKTSLKGSGLSSTQKTVFRENYSQKIVLLFISLLTAPIVKNRHILTGIYFIFLKSMPDQTWKSFNTKFQPP